MSVPVTSGILERLKDQVGSLYGRVNEVADLAELIKNNALPPQLPAAFVVPSRERASPSDMDGITRQEVSEITSVIIVARKAGEATGAAGAASANAIGDDCLVALVGWQLSPQHDVCEYVSRQLLGIQAGAVFVQLDFVTRWWLRQ